MAGKLGLIPGALLALTALAGAVGAQGPVVQLHLDGDVDSAGSRSLDISVAGTPVFIDGIAGQALDLSAPSANRRAVVLGEPGDLPYGAGQDFSVMVWVQMQPGITDHNAILTNTNWELARREWPAANGARKAVGSGWAIAAQPSGSWSWMASSGATRLDYQPTADRQPIHDGLWHMLAFTIDRVGQDARLYYDGINVAVYHLAGIGDLTSEWSTVVGADAADERDEMFSFHGLIDEVSLWNRALSGEEIEGAYRRFLEARTEPPAERVTELRVMAFNIWHGGREHGEVVGVDRVVDVIRDYRADVVAMVETYGSGPRIADALGYHFYLRSTNLSILSRFPIGETLDAWQPFNCGGARLALSPGQEIAFYTLWINHLPSSRTDAARPGATAAALIAAEMETRGAQIQSILADMAPVIADADRVPVIVGGDFNSLSHADWGSEAAGIHDGLVVEWPVSKAMVDAGFTETYRQIYPDTVANPGLTHRSGSRIDYIYYQGRGLRTVEAGILSRHPAKFPSDHYAVAATLRLPDR